MSRPKTTTKVRRPLLGSGLLHVFHSKADDLPAHLTREDDLEEGQPSLKVSRAFAIGLGLHVVAILGFMAFTMIRKSDSIRNADVAPTAGTSSGSAPAPENPPPPAPMHAAVTQDTPRQDNAASLNPPPSTTPAPAPTPSPEASQTASNVIGSEDPENQGLRYHVVVAGETVKGIAETYGVEARALAEKNDLLSGKKPFEAGLRLIVPARQIAGSTTPEAGSEVEAQPVGRDTPPIGPDDEDGKPTRSTAPLVENKPTKRAEPAGKVTAPPKNFADVTPPTPSRKELPKPEPKKTEKKVEASKNVARNEKPAARETSGKGRVHVVAQGETAYRIAVNHKVDVKKLIQVNKIDPMALRPGMRLIIPGR